MDILLTRYFYPCFLFECTCCNLPATITIETSFLVLQIEITGNFSLRSFEHSKEGIPPARCILQISSERTGPDIFAVKHWSTGKLMFSRPQYLHRKNFIFNHSQSLPCGPGTCVGSKGSGWPGNWFECTAGREEESTSDRPGLHLQSALVQASLLLKHQPTGQHKRTRPLTSYPVSQSCVLPTNHEAGHVFSPTRKVGGAFFRTHLYCDSSPCFADPALLSVVGFCGL